MFERMVYLVRHGHCDPRATDWFNVGLTSVGQDQAVATAERLRSIGASAVYCSTLARARQTADIVGSQFPSLSLRQTKLLWELPNIGPAENDEWRQVFDRGIRRGGRAFAYYIRPSRNSEAVDVLVTHGNLVRYFVCRVLGMRPESWSVLGTSHCGITQLRVSPEGRIQLIRYNDTGHLPRSLCS